MDDRQALQYTEKKRWKFNKKQNELALHNHLYHFLHSCGYLLVMWKVINWRVSLLHCVDLWITFFQCSDWKRSNILSGSGISKDWWDWTGNVNVVQGIRTKFDETMAQVHHLEGIKAHKIYSLNTWEGIEIGCEIYSWSLSRKVRLCLQQECVFFSCVVLAWVVLFILPDA